MKKLSLICLLLMILLGLNLVSAATLKGIVYDSNLEPVPAVLVSVNTTPYQQLLAKDGEYQFNLPLGKYLLTASKNGLNVSEEINVASDGDFVLDLFLLPGLSDEEELFQETEESYFQDAETLLPEDWAWAYLALILILAFLLFRIFRARLRYGSLYLFRKKMNVEQAKTLEQHKEDLAKEPGYIEKAVEILRKHDGRITQKELRKEMLYLSEAKISLIITELEHQGKVEKIKKGRGNVIILK